MKITNLSPPLFHFSIYYKNKKARPNFGAKLDMKIKTVKFIQDPTLLYPSPTVINKIIEATVPY